MRAMAVADQLESAISAFPALFSVPVLEWVLEQVLVPPWVPSFSPVLLRLSVFRPVSALFSVLVEEQVSVPVVALPWVPPFSLAPPYLSVFRYFPAYAAGSEAGFDRRFDFQDRDRSCRLNPPKNQG